MRALITGATGFIGSYLTKSLSERGYEVYCLVRKSSKFNRLEKLKVNPNLIYGDITDFNSLEKAVANKDYIFHLAAIINANSREDYYRINYEGTKNIARAATLYNPNLKKFIYISSIAASGPSKRNYFKNEDDKCQPINNYGKTKLLGEKAIKEELQNIPYTIIRPPNVIGPGQKELVQSITTIERGIMPLLGNGEPQTSIIHVSDLVKAIVLAAELDKTTGKTYFITDGKQYSWQEIAKIIKKELGKRFVFPLNFPILIVTAFLLSIFSKTRGTVNPVSPKRIVQMRKNYWTYNGSKANKELGFRAKVNIYDGIREAVKDYLKEKKK